MYVYFFIQSLLYESGFYLINVNHVNYSGPWGYTQVSPQSLVTITGWSRDFASARPSGASRTQPCRLSDAKSLGQPFIKLGIEGIWGVSLRARLINPQKSVELQGKSSDLPEKSIKLPWKYIAVLSIPSGSVYYVPEIKGMPKLFICNFLMFLTYVSRYLRWLFSEFSRRVGTFEGNIWR